MKDIGAGLVFVVALVALVAILAFTALYAWSRSRGAAGAERWLPRELRGAELALSEQRFVSRRHGLVARLDRAYRAGDRLHLVELKTRGYHEARPSDVIELSVQRLVVQEQTGQPVSPVAYVAVQQDGQGTPRPIRVRLHDEAEVLALRRRLLEVRAARGPRPQPTRSPNACRQCGHRDSCQRMFGDRN